MGMYFQYGSYKHADNEVGFIAAVTSLESSQLTEYALKFEWNLIGQLLLSNYSDYNAFLAGITDLVEAYSADDQDAGLYFTGGSPTIYTVKVSDTKGGVRVLKKPAVTGYNGSVFGNFYPYSIQIEFIMDSPNGWGEIKEWVESLSVKGDGGNLWVMTTSLTGSPRKEVLAQFTPVECVQRGHALGWSSYPTPAAPLFDPSVEHTDRREVHPTSPLAIGNINGAGGALVDYGIDWAYYFEGTADQIQGVNPTTRPE